MKALPLLDAESFARFGFFTRRGFLDDVLCRRLRRALRVAPERPGEIWVRGRSTLAPAKRQVAVLQPPARLREEVDRAFLHVMPALARHFDVPLRDHEGVQYLRYAEGGHYVLHTDRTPGARDPKVVGRRVSIIVFLNRIGRGRGAHEGGELVFRWAGPGKSRARYPIALRPEPGLLLAFHPEIEHEVRPVIRGLRYTLATWFV